ncbi:MAG: pirin family protein [Actinobacteria bacterium]|nr:pirin family protein [Actinomycetota bacterium]MCB9388059.1 pirin family protein [Acidimicrobiia bacterium]
MTTTSTNEPRSNESRSHGNPLIETFELGAMWPTVDPFLFCAHHDDRYPVGTEELGPEPGELVGRAMGEDFSRKDGWSMYHGSVVPGFPQHPHRGFETVTYLTSGYVDHADSLGATARYGPGDVQWLTAGSGIQHAEMFPLLDHEEANPLNLFQLWLNLPRNAKMATPAFEVLWAEEIPVVSGDGWTVRVIAGPWNGQQPIAPPPNSWAADPDHDVAIWHISLAGGEVELPAAAPGSNRVLYVFGGDSATLDGATIKVGNGALVDASEARHLASANADLLVLQAKPIGEPVAKYGPFVMNTEAEIRQAFMDYERTRFGGWPWPTSDPNHGPEPRRFAVHPDGRTSTPPQTSHSETEA